jgi:hypothetical protein
MTEGEYKMFRHRIILVAQLVRQTGDPGTFINEGVTQWEARATTPELIDFAGKFGTFFKASQAFLQSIEQRLPLSLTERTAAGRQPVRRDGKHARGLDETKPLSRSRFRHLRLLRLT